MFDLKSALIGLTSLAIGAGGATAYHNSTVVNYSTINYNECVSLVSDEIENRDQNKPLTPGEKRLQNLHKHWKKSPRDAKIPEYTW